MKSYLDITNRYLMVQKKRSMLAIIGIALSVSLLTGIGTLFTSWWSGLIKDAIQYSGDYHGCFESVEENKVHRVINHTDAKDYGIICREGFAKLGDIEKKEGLPPIRYFTVEAFNDSVKKMIQLDVEEGRLPTAHGEVAIDNWSLKYLPEGTKIGDVINLDTGTRVDGNGKILGEPHKWSDKEVFKPGPSKQYKIVGFIKPIAVPNKFFAYAITWLDDSKLQEGKKYDVLLKLDPIKDIHERIRKIGSDAGLDISENGSNEIVFNEKLLRLLAQSTNPFLNSSMLTIIAIIVLMVIIATIAVIYNAFNISIIERISQFGLMRCVGATPGQIRKTVIKEALTLGLIGIPIGLVMGTIAMELVFRIIKVIAPLVEFANLNLVVSPYIIFGSSLLGIITVLLSALLPAWKASRVSPVEAIRNSFSFKKESFKKVKKSWLSLKIFGVEGWIARKNLGRNRKRFYVTVFSMVISIVLFIVFGSLVDFAFKSGFGDKTENPNFAIKNAKEGLSVELSDQEYKDIMGKSGVKYLFKYGSTKGDAFVTENKVNKKVYEIMGTKLEKNDNNKVILHSSSVIACGDDSLNCLRDYLTEGSINIDAIKNGNGVVVIKSGMIYDNKKKRPVILDVAYIKPGDEISVKVNPGKFNKNPSPTEKKLKVVAILNQGAIGDARNEAGGIEIITSENLYKEITGASNYPEIVGVQLENDADGKAVKDYLEDYVDNNPQYQFMDFDQYARNYAGGWVVLSIFLYGFVAVISLIGCINIINTISTNIVLRTRELSVMRAVGMTEGAIKKLVCMESILHGIFAIVIGTTIGCALSKLLYNYVIGVREFEWNFPMFQVLVAAAGTILVAVIAGYVPLKRINRGVIIEGIRAEE